MTSDISQVRANVCLFTFADGRRCRTPRSRNHAYFCVFHARKEAQAQAAENFGKDLSYFFSGDYHSASDLTTTLGHTIQAVAQGHIDTKTATAINQLSQTLRQTIPLAQHEYLKTFGQNSWTSAVRNSVNENYNHLHPPASSEQPPSQIPSPAPPPNPPQLQDAAPAAEPEQSDEPQIIYTSNLDRLLALATPRRCTGGPRPSAPLYGMEGPRQPARL
jgi:hypothetical protein